MYKPAIKLLTGPGLFLLFAGLACSLGGAEPTATPAPLPTDVPVLPTQTPAPTATLAPTATNQPPPPLPTNPPLPSATVPSLPPPPATEPVSNEPPAFYVEEFGGDLSNYSYFVYLGVDGGDEMIFQDEDDLVFNIANQDTWVYFTYDAYTYADVRIGLSAANRGVNSQRVSLICRASEDGWFEFNIGGDGLYEIYVYDDFNDGFYLIGNGGSTAINLGKDTNEYVAECIGNTLTLYINGVFINSFDIPNDYRFMDEGLVGFAVSSFNSVPVNMRIEWFGIEEP